jgi:hypothetical protein
MKVILDIKDNKMAFFMEMMSNLSFVKKATPLSDEKAKLIEEFTDAINELNLTKTGQLQAKNAEDLLDEL